MIWKLKRTAYGLKDASRGFYLNFSGKLQDFGCEKSLLDPAMFIYFEETNKSEFSRKPAGIAVTHVDDILHSGNEEFNKKVMKPLKRSFKFGSEEEGQFRYVGLNMKQTESDITVDQRHYVLNMKEPDLSNLSHLQSSDILDDYGQTEFRSAVAKLATVAYTSRPDYCFEVKSLSCKYGKAKKSDLRAVARKIVLLKAEEPMQLKYPDMGNVEDWILLGFGDAGIRSMTDKVTSVGGKIILLCNRKTGNAAALNW